MATLKGRVNRILREQKDMGKLSAPAVQFCVLALEAFVHDLGTRVEKHADACGVQTVTPVELKQCVLVSNDFAFLHEKVALIDESSAKYHRTPTVSSRKRQTSASKSDGPSTTKKKAKKSVAKESITTEKQEEMKALSSQVRNTVDIKQSIKKGTAQLMKEDDDYDASDSDS